MALVPNIRDGDWTSVRKAIQQISSTKLGPIAAVTHANLTLNDLTAVRLIATDANKLLVSSDLVNWVTGTANEVDITDDGDGTITIGIVNPLIVAKGGTGLATITDHSIILGSGTGAVTPLGVASNGQIPIGSTGADPVLATITGTTNQVNVANAAGTITLSTPQDIHTSADVTFDELILTTTLKVPHITFDNAQNIMYDNGDIIIISSASDISLSVGNGAGIYTFGNAELELNGDNLKTTGDFTDGTNAVSAAECLIAYNHSQDNSQAHSDYLINNGDDSTSGALTVGSLISGTITGTGLHTVNQTADASGIQVVGFDDENDRNITIGILSDGTARIEANSDWYFKRSGTTVIFMSAAAATFYLDLRPRYDATKYGYGQFGGDGYLNFDGTNVQFVASAAHNFNFVGYTEIDVGADINVTGVYKVDDVQVVSNRIIDARCNDALNSGDATTDGVIDALRDAMITHGLIAAA